MDFARFAYGLREAAAVLVILIIFPLLVDKGTKVFLGKPSEVVAAQKQVSDIDAELNALYRQSPKYESDEWKAQQEKINELNSQRRKFADVEFVWYQSIQATRFYIALVFGLLAIIVGIFVDVPSLGTGLVLGGGFVISRGYWDYWNLISDLFAFISLLVVLLAIAGALWHYSRNR